MTWQKVKLGEVCEILDHKRKPLNNVEREIKRGNGTYPYFGANGIVDRIDEYIFDELICCVAEDGGYWGANQKCSYLVNEKCWVNNHAHVLRAKDKISLPFLSSFLNVADLNSYITGSTRGKLTKGALERIEIPLPPLEEQKRLAAILDRADELRRVRRESLARLDELGQSLFLELFGDPATNPKGWEVVKLGEVTQINPRLYNALLTDEEISFVPMAYVLEEGRLYREESRKFAEVKTGFTPFQRGDILFAKITPCFENGKIAIATIHKNHGFGSTEFHVIRASDELTTNIFLLYFLRQRRIRLEGERKMTGSAGQRRVPKHFLETLSLPLPPLALQQQFAAQIEELEAIKTRARASLLELDALFASLQARAFAGEL